MYACDSAVFKLQCGSLYCNLLFKISVIFFRLVRLHQDRLELIKDVIKFDVSAYSKPQNMVDLALLLKPPDSAADEKATTGRVLCVLAEKAFQVKMQLGTFGFFLELPVKTQFVRCSFILEHLKDFPKICFSTLPEPKLMQIWFS